MARALSLNWDVQLGADPSSWIFPTSIGEFGEGEEGRIDVADGDIRYKIKDEIFDVGEIPITILLKKDRRELELMEAWATAQGVDAIRDVYLVGRGAGRNNEDGTGREIVFTYLLRQCECARGKKNAFDRQGKTFDTKSYILIPADVEEVV
jgi:hypothetical protein